MTRINCVPPKELTNKHLVAEYRELPRVVTLAVKAFGRGEDFNKYPKQYVLGTGHVKFFYDKLAWIHERYTALIAEMRHRKFKMDYDLHSGVFQSIYKAPLELYNTWTPNKAALELNRQRIEERLNGNSK